MDIHSEEGHRIALSYSGYVERMSDPFAFHMTIVMNGFAYDRRVAFSHDAITIFIRAVQQFINPHHHGATLATEDGDVTIELQAYGKRGYILVRTHVHFATKPTIAEGILIDNAFMGGFVAEPARLNDWIDELQHIIAPYNSL